MRSLLSLALISAAGLWAQAQPSPDSVEKMKSAAQSATQPAKPATDAAKPPMKTVHVTVPAPAIIPINQLPPDTTIATVDGKKVTAGDLQAVLRALPQQVQQQAQADRRKFVEQYGVLRRLADEAKKDGLDKQSPFREALEYGTMQVLYQAEINKKIGDYRIPMDEVTKQYEANKDRYSQVKVKAIYLPFSNAPVSQADSKGKQLPAEAEAKAKAEQLAKEARGGADFVTLVKEDSRDAASVAKEGDFGYLHKTDQIPADLKAVLFTAKPGDITEPVRQANGFYIFRIEEAGAQPLDQVQGAITDELKQKRFGEWLSALQKSVDVKMEHELPAGMQAAPSSVSPVPAQK